MLQAQSAQQQQAAAPLLEFKAGILTMTGTTVTADNRRGTVNLAMDEDDGCLHVTWKVRPSGQKELDLAMFGPAAATIEKIPECTTGRVLLLEMKQSKKRTWFWMQEAKEDKDDSILEKFLNLINNPPTSQGQGQGQGNQQQQGMYGPGMDDAQLQQLLLASMTGAGNELTPRTPGTTTTATVTPSTTTATTTTTATATPSTTTTTTTTTATATPSTTTPAPATDASLEATLAAFRNTIAQASQGDNDTIPTLAETLKSQRLLDALDDEDKKALLPHMPESQQNSHQLDQALRSPQFQQTVNRLDGILNSAQCPELMQSFSLPHVGDIGVNAFLDALQGQGDAESSSSSTSASDDNDTQMKDDDEPAKK